MSESNTNKDLEGHREEALFQAALQLAAADRDQFLSGACRGNSALRQRLEALLAAHEQTDALLATEPEPARPTIKVDLVDAQDEAIGQTIGRYKLLEKVGEGGCGVVYVAEQTEPVRRRVALKVIKLGMDTKAVVARFEAERQALAMMDHPNIAKVLDGGTTETGRPYFVMELVRGIRITDYCDQAKLNAKERLDLFIKACQAIQHAHQKGIIHRDIKPSNILVTLHDGVPVPKVIDFGIAKATEGRLTDATVYTQLHQFIGTPAYMSPEQAEMSGLDIDTRSDIYSMGVLLYELLAGSTPFDAKELMASGIDAMRRTIREKEPMRPSTRLATLKAEDLTTTAKRRSCDAPKLIHLLRGDLDWIVMKCLEKDRTRRYETANGLATDLKRHLENEPVVARPPSKVYRFQKAFRRNKLACTAGVAVVLALVAGLSLASLGWRQTRTERDKALQARAGEEIQRNAAQEQTKRAEIREAEARRLLYVANMNLIQQAWEQHNIDRVGDLLDETQAFPDRGFEWYYWQRQTHLVFHTLRGLGPVSSVALSPDGQRLVTAGVGAKVWEASSGRELFTLKSDDVSITSLAFSPDGQRIVGARGNGSAKIWDAASGKELLTLTGHTNWISSVAFSPDGRRIVTGSWDSSAKLWNPSDGRELLTFKTDGAQVTAVAFSPESKSIVTCSTAKTEVWDADSGRVLLVLNAQNSAVAFAPDAKRIVTGGMDGTAKVWDAASGRELLSLKGHVGLIWSVAFSPDGQRIVTGSEDATAKEWDATSGQELRTLKGYDSFGQRSGNQTQGWKWSKYQRHIASVRSVVFSPDGQRIVTGSYDGTVKVWPAAADNALSAHKEHGRMVPTLRVAFSLDGQRIATCSSIGTVTLWDATSARELLSFRDTNGAIFSLALSPDGHRIVTGGFQAAKVWEAAGGRELLTMNARSISNSPSGIPLIESAVYSPDGQRIVTLADGVAKLWDAASGRELFTIMGHRISSSSGELPDILSVTLSPDSHWILTSDLGGTKELWDVADGRKVRTLKGIVVSMAFSPDSQRIVTGSADQTAKVCETATGQELLTLRGHTDWISSVAFSWDGQRIVTGSKDQTAKVWDAASGRELLTLKGHNGSVSSVAFSPNGRRIITGSADKTAKLWDVASGREVLTVKGHSADVSFVAFSPNGQWMITGRDGHVEKVWEAARPEQVVQWHAEETAATPQ